MATNDPASGIEAFARSLTTGDEDAIRAFLSDDYFGHARGAGEPSQADRWVAISSGVRGAIRDLAIDVRPEVREDGTVAAHAVVTGTHSAPLWGAPATGSAQHVELDLVLRRLDDGWVINVDGSPMAAMGALRGLGVVPRPDEMHLPPKHPVAPPEFLLKLAFTGQAADKSCAHLAAARVFEPSVGECAECVAVGGFWPALRMCLVCGYVGCCDTSVNKHMRAHFEATGHSIFRSIRLEEGWIWCYEDAAFFERAMLDRLATGGRS